MRIIDNHRRDGLIDYAFHYALYHSLLFEAPLIGHVIGLYLIPEVPVRE